MASSEGYANTLGTGTISGINRKNVRWNDFQTTASIAHGSSGGALFDIYGNVIGITYGGFGSVGDIGIVIPINEVKTFLKKAMKRHLCKLIIL